MGLEITGGRDDGDADPDALVAALVPPGQVQHDGLAVAVQHAQPLAAGGDGHRLDQR